MTKQVNADFVPQGAYTFSDANTLNSDLLDRVVIEQFYQGDILRANDPRLAKLGDVGSGSLVLRNPGAIPAGDVLYPMSGGNASSLGLVPNDHIDILLTACFINNTTCGNCSATQNQTQTTLQNVLVYAVTPNEVWLVLNRQDALTLKFISDGGHAISIVLRAPGDTNIASTSPITGTYIYQHFHFTQVP
jgi:hypothetical protein